LDDFFVSRGDGAPLFAFGKTNGKWMIVHEHFSAPFDPESGKSLLNLEPEPVEQSSAT
jgi:hypothetical protein